VIGPFAKELASLRTKLRSSRNRLVLNTAALSLVARAISMVTLFVTVPLVLHSVGRERFGIWSACLGAAGLLTLADGGITVNLISRIAKAAAKNDNGLIKRLIMSSFIMSVSVSFVFILTWVALSGLIDWTWLLNLSSPSLGPEARWVMVILGCSYALSFPPTVIRNTRLGLLHGPIVNLWDIAGGLCSLALIAFLMTQGKGIVALALAWGLMPAFMRVLHAIAFLSGKGRVYIPSRSDIDPSMMFSLLRGGGAYLLVTLLQIVALQTDQTVVGHLLGASQVTDYAILQRLFAQPQVIVNIVVTSQWAAYADASGRGAQSWIRRMLKFSLIGTAVMSITVCALLALLLQPILHLWVGDKVTTTPLLIASMAVFGVVSALANVFIYFHLSMHEYRHLIKVNAAMLAIIFPLDFLLVPRVGSSGAVIAISIAYIVAVLIPGFYRFSRLPETKASQSENVDMS
jgi:O-antigen/teichoic acid export membrane protein